MKVRLILVCTLLLLAAVPTFALPLCAECVEESCAEIPGSIERCNDWSGACRTSPLSCIRPRSETVLTEWKVASIEIQRPSLDSITLTAPAVVAQTDVRNTEPVEQK